MSWTSRIAWFLVTGGGLGALPWAPGTFGTFGGMLLAAAVLGMFPGEPTQTIILAILLLAACIVNISLGRWSEVYFGNKDPQAVTIDEIAGYLLTILIATSGARSWWLLVFCFLAFRVFDVAKLPPARQAEKLQRGWGVLLDDLVSAIYAGLFVRAGYWLAGW